MLSLIFFFFKKGCPPRPSGRFPIPTHFVGIKDKAEILSRAEKLGTFRECENQKKFARDKAEIDNNKLTEQSFIIRLINSERSENILIKIKRDIFFTYCLR